MELERLNEDFAIAGHLTLIEGDGGLLLAKVSNRYAEALISVYAGQVLSYKPKGFDQDLFFVSGLAYFEEGKSIKGGIPVCWPWFGDDPEKRGRPSHGFVRNRQWRINSTAVVNEDCTELVLGMSSSKETHAFWPHDFELRLEVIVGETLDVRLVTVNKNKHEISITQALHSYFQVGDVTTVQVHGLDGCQYLDKLEGFKEKTQQGAVTVNMGVDRIYLDTGSQVEIDDASLQRKIVIDSQGSHSTVVWNPWDEISQAMADLGDDDYQQMICVETTNAATDQVTIQPAQSYTLGASFKLQAQG